MNVNKSVLSTCVVFSHVLTAFTLQDDSQHMLKSSSVLKHFQYLRIVLHGMYNVRSRQDLTIDTQAV